MYSMTLYDENIYLALTLENLIPTSIIFIAQTDYKKILIYCNFVLFCGIASLQNGIFIQFRKIMSSSLF